MKILLDESLPEKLKKRFGSEDDLWTVRDKGGRDASQITPATKIGR